MESIAAYFKFAERKTDLATEIRAGVTTFMVMAYIIFVNPSILAAAGIDQAAAAAATALVAGRHDDRDGRRRELPARARRRPRDQRHRRVHARPAASGLTPAGAMGVIVIEGVIITLLVLVGLPRGDHERRPARR